MLILLRNRVRSLAQQRGGWLRKAVGGGRKLQGKKCAPLKWEALPFCNTTIYRRWNLNCGILRFLIIIMRNVRFNEILKSIIVPPNDIW